MIKSRPTLLKFVRLPNKADGAHCFHQKCEDLVSAAVLLLLALKCDRKPPPLGAARLRILYGKNIEQSTDLRTGYPLCENLAELIKGDGFKRGLCGHDQNSSGAKRSVEQVSPLERRLDHPARDPARGKREEGKVPRNFTIRLPSVSGCAFGCFLALSGLGWSKSPVKVTSYLAGNHRVTMEAEEGIEPSNSGFANRCLTTWLLRRDALCRGADSLRSRAGAVNARVFFR